MRLQFPVSRALGEKELLSCAGNFGCGAFDYGSFDVIVVGAGDYFELDVLRAGGFAFTNIRAVGKALDIHLLDHGECAAVALRLALRQVTEMRNFCADEESGGGVGTGGDACATADTRGGVHGQVSIFFRNGNGVAVGSAAGWHGNEAAGGDDAVKGAAVYGEILDDREAPWRAMAPDKSRRHL